MKIGYFLGGFPVVSETFVTAQIAGMIRRGHDVCIEADRPLGSADAVPPDLLKRTIYRTELKKNLPSRFVQAAEMTIAEGWKSPLGLLDSLNVFKYGRQAVNLTVFNEKFSSGRLRERFDVIHCHFGPQGRKAVLRRKTGLLQGPVITTFHGIDVNPLLKDPADERYRELFAVGELFTVGSDFMRRQLAKLGAPQNKILKHPMGVDLSKFEFANRDGEGAGVFELLSVGRLVEVKGFEYLLRALSVLAQQGVPLKCSIAGDGPLRKELENLSRQLGLQEVVRFLGAVSQEETGRLYRKAQCFVLAGVVTETGEEEGQGLVLAEAQASGLPVVAASVGGIPECVKDGVSGRLVPQRNPEALASAIHWLITHPEARLNMGRAGRSFVEEQYNLDKLNDRLERHYLELSSRHKG